ncbi:MAG: hypothetical protein BEN19_01110, partial [Epulopiscium sp. Nuni2H_MBin003]
YSYYYYRKRRGHKKRLYIIALILGAIFTGYLVRLYYIQTGINGGEFIVLHENRGDFVQNMINYYTYKQIPQVKGIYIPAYKTSNIDELIALANETEVNSFVIDVKDDNGHLTFNSTNPVLKEAGCIRNSPYIRNISSLMESLYLNNIYPIARIVVFKDKIASGNHPERMVLNHDGEIYTNSQGESWLNPYMKDNWDYILEVCKEAINVGFKEIQFDYIRFHESMSTERVDLPTDLTKTEIITQFVDFMMEQLKPYGVVVSADVFGTIITSNIDASIVGQDYQELIKRLDVICPMIYPSHYNTGAFGQAYPDLAPYEIILGALQASNETMRQIPIEERKAIVRPWLQDFTATWVEPHQTYTAVQIRQQINAVYDAILSEWLLWNGAANYTKDGLEKKPE